jgi:hypothetical protein
MEVASRVPVISEDGAFTVEKERVPAFVCPLFQAADLSVKPVLLGLPLGGDPGVGSGPGHRRFLGRPRRPS